MTSVVWLSVLFMLALGWPILRAHFWPVIAYGYQLRYEYRQMQGKRKLTRLLAGRLEPFYPAAWLRKIERQMRLAGRPWAMTAAELLTLQIAGGIGLILFGLIAIPPAQHGVWFLLSALLVFFPQNRLKGLIKKRQLEARSAARFAKRRLLEKLRLGLNLDEALRSTAEITPGEFGDTLRRLVAQLKTRALKSVAQDLRREYEVPEIDTLATALEYADEKTPASLIESLRLQIEEEDDQVEELIEAQLASATPKLYGVIALSVVFTLVVSGVFFWLAMQREMIGGPFGGFTIGF